MVRRRRLFCLLSALFFLIGSVPLFARAEDDVFFTAVNDTMLPLADETMPFVAGGTLYVAATAFDGAELGVYCSRSREKNTVMLYKRRSVLLFDLAAGTIETNDGKTYTGSAVTRGDVVFLPADLVCRFFELDYSLSRVTHGYLLRLRSETAVLSDASFIDAADAAMSARYARYARTRTEPTAPPQPAEPPAENIDTSPQNPKRRTVHLIIECTDPTKAEQLLSRLGSGRATWLFTPDSLQNAGDMLRRLAAGQGAAALRIDATGGAESTVAQIEAANRALWAAAHQKTRLVWLDGAPEATARAVTAVGYCPIRAALNLGDRKLSTARVSAQILAAADQYGGACPVFLGTDTALVGKLGALIAALRAEGCTSASLSEITASNGNKGDSSYGA